MKAGFRAPKSRGGVYNAMAFLRFVNVKRPGFFFTKRSLRAGRQGVESGVTKSLIFHWFHKVLRHRGNTMRKPSLANAFSMISKPFFPFCLNSHQNSLCFIRFSASEFCHSEKWIFHWFYKVFRRCGNAIQKPSLGNAFPMILTPILRIRSKFHQDTICFIRFPASEFCLSEKLIFH